jgi:membrane protein
MNAFIKAANRAYSVEETRPFWRRYLTALFLTVCAGVALVAAFGIFVVGWWFGSRMAALVGLRPSFENVGQAAFWPTVGLLITVGISVLYWAAPNVRMRFRWAVPGAVVFTIAWLGATTVFTRYVDDLGSYGLTYGTLAGAVVLLLWFYLTALLLLVGIEFSALLAEHGDPDEIDAQQQRTREDAAVRQLPPRSAGTMTPGEDVA